ncbi:MAG: hypothetical protein GXP25_05770 [Planctomycetes bacterium]|nr:hypothetical protein [Planctomycetota bacterium]
MDKIGPIITNVGGLLVAVGMVVVLLRVGKLIDALSEALGGKPCGEADEEKKEEG